MEVMISESQERMVAIVAPERLADVEAVIDRWELHRAVIGEVTETGLLLHAFWDEDEVGSIPARLLTDECPRYAVASEPRLAPPETPTSIPAPGGALLALLAFRRSGPARSSPAGTTSSSSRARSAARGSMPPCCGCVPPGAASLTLDGQSRLGVARPAPRRAGRDPRGGAQRRVRGRRAGRLPGCLNFGNPKPEVGWELAEAIEGMALACEALGVPVVSGNVSLYNDTDGARSRRRRWWAASASSRTFAACRAAGATATPFSSSGRAPRSRSPAPRRRRAGGLSAARRRSTSPPRSRSCATRPWSRGTSLVHDVAEGGLAVALAEAALWSGVGATLELDDDPLALFGEVGGQLIVALPSGEVEPDPTGSDVEVRRIGTVGGASLLGVPLAGLRSPTWETPDVCGVFGVHSVERDVARLTYFGLFALSTAVRSRPGSPCGRRRGHGAAGDGARPQVFDEEKLSALPGDVAIGRTRYSTTGGAYWSNAQPLVPPRRGPRRRSPTTATSSTRRARTELSPTRVRLASTSDTEVIAALLGRDPAPLPEAVAGVMSRLEGAYSIVAIADGALVAFRDPLGIRPLTLGRIGDDWVVASETCALDLVGADVVRDVLRASSRLGRRRRLPLGAALPRGRGAACIFEHVYFARPDSLLGGTGVHAARVRMGERLAEAPAVADLVMPIPDSGTPAAIGFAKRSGIPYEEGLIKNRYVGRTFIQPDQGSAARGSGSSSTRSTRSPAGAS